MAEPSAAPVAPETTPAPAAESNTSDMSVRDLAMQDIDLDDTDTADSTTEGSDSDDEGQKGDDTTSSDDDSDQDQDDGGDATDQDADDEGADQKTDEQSEDQKSRAEQRKDELNTEIRDLVSRRNELRKQVAQINDSVYGARTVEELMDEVNPDTGENYTAIEAKVKSMEEAAQLRDYNDQVAEAQLVINTESQRVVQEFPMFNENSPEYKKDIAEAADEIFALNLVRDPNTEQVDDKGNKIPGTGQIIGTHLPIYKLYKLIADAAQVATADGQIKGQKAVKKMMASADTVSGNGPKTPSDKGIDAFDAEFDKYDR